MNQIECGEGDPPQGLAAVGMQLGFGALFTAVTLWAFPRRRLNESYDGV